jgi:hypothetical protein
MPQLGGKSGLINEAVNHHTNEALTEAIKYMGTKEYQQSRDLTDVIPTHKKQVQNKLARPEDKHLPVHTNEKKDHDAAADAESAGAALDDDDDEEFMALRNQRMQGIKKQTEKMAEWNAKGHGTYREITQDEFFNTVVREKGGSDMVVVHFYHREFPRCLIIDKHLERLCQQMLPIKFVKCNVEKSPFLTEKLRVNVLPCCVLFVNDVACDRIVGFDGLEMTEKQDDIDGDSLKLRIEVGLGLAEAE